MSPDEHAAEPPNAQPPPTRARRRPPPPAAGPEPDRDPRGLASPGQGPDPDRGSRVCPAPGASPEPDGGARRLTPTDQDGDPHRGTRACPPPGREPDGAPRAYARGPDSGLGPPTDPGPELARGQRGFTPGPDPDPVCTPFAFAPADAGPETGPWAHAPLDRVLPDLDAVERWARDVGGYGGGGPQDVRYDVETISVDGMHHVVRCTGEGPAGECAAVRSVVRALLDLAGHRSGPSRIGVAFSDGRPRIVAWDLAPYRGGGPHPVETDELDELDATADQMRSPGLPRAGNAPGPVRERPPEL